MRSFFNLVGFEYKKIFKRKGSIIAIALIIILSSIGPTGLLIGKVYIEGELVERNYEAMVKDRNYARALSGRSIDKTLLTEVKDAYMKIPPVGKNESYVGSPEYQEYGRPYSEIYNIVYSVYGSQYRLMQNVSEEHMQNFYQIRHDEILNNINAMDVSEESKDKLILLDNQIETPFIFEYTGGYDYFFSMLYSTGVFAAFTIAVCLAPMFAGEYGTRTDQLILSSKFGKNKVIVAKMFAGVSLAAGLCAVMTILTYLVGSIIFGFDGANAPIQLWFTFCIYPLTMCQAAVIYSVCVFFAAILVSAITMLLSSVFKSPFGVIIILSLLIFIPMMLNVQQTNILLYNLFRLLPSNMMWLAMTLVDYTPFELFGLSVMPYVFMPVFSALVAVVTFPFSYRSFKNHQIG